MPTGFTFGQIEAVCAALNRIASDKRVAFMGRMKQLQKQGLTEAERRPGKGKAGTYSFGDLMRFVLAVELTQAGMMPLVAARIVSGNWDVFRAGIYMSTFTAAEQVPGAPIPNEYCWMIEPEALRSLTVDGEGPSDHFDSVRGSKISDLGKILTAEVYGRRILVINGYALTQGVIKLVAFQFRYASILEMRQDLGDELERIRQTVKWVRRQLAERANPTAEQLAAMDAFMKRIGRDDYTANPPIYAPVLDARAQELVPMLSPEIRSIIESAVGDESALNEKTMGELLDLGLFTIEETPPESGDGRSEIGLSLTPFGKAVARILNPEWAAAIEAADFEARINTPLRIEAAKLIKTLREDQKEAILDGDTIIFSEPLLSEMKALGIVEQEASSDDWLGSSVGLTELGKAVLYLLLAPYRMPKEAEDGDC